MALAEHNLVRAERDLGRAVGRSRQSERDLSSDEVAAYKHCAVLLLRAVAGARLESSMRSALSEWKAAAWALTLTAQLASASASASRRTAWPAEPEPAGDGASCSSASLGGASCGRLAVLALQATLLRVRAARLAWGLGRWARGASALVADEAAWVDLAAADRDLAAAEDEVVRVQAECRQREGRVQAEAAAGRRQAAQQAKWAVVSMQKLGVQMRCDALLQPQP